MNETEADTPSQRWNFFEAECHRHLGITATEFLRRLEAGYYHNDRLPQRIRAHAERLRTLLPFTTMDPS